LKALLILEKTESQFYYSFGHVQKFGVKVCRKDWHCSYGNLLNVANIPTLASRRQQLKLCQLFNIINANSVFFLTHHSAARRVSPYLSSIRYQQTQPHSLNSLPTPFLYQTPFFVISLWKALPRYVCKIHSLSNFK